MKAGLRSSVSLIRSCPRSTPVARGGHVGRRRGDPGGDLAIDSLDWS